MAEAINTATIVAKDGVFAIRFEPPIDKVESFHKGQSGHPIRSVIPQGPKIRWVIYDQGVFGWSEVERESDFIDYCEVQAAQIGYQVINGLAHAPEELPVPQSV